MRLKTAFLVASLALVGFIGTAAAQAPATFLLKSGEKIHAELIDYNASGYVISVNGQERSIRPDDLAVIDFTGDAQNFPANETQKIPAGQSLMVMRDGQMYTGHMNDIGGDRPKVIYFTGGPQSVTADRVARIYLSTPPAAATATAGSGSQAATDQPGTIHVSAKEKWTPTGITVRRGQVVQFSSSGTVQLSTNASDTAEVAGGNGAAPAGSPMPGTLRGALVGRIGNGKPFAIGNQSSVPMPANGPLYLGVNDDNLLDNSGEFVVTITGQSGTAMPRR